MVKTNVLAQATQAPSNGASNADDFHPPTRNPQVAPGSLQPGAPTQNTSGQDVLNNPNARLSVPTTSSTPGETVATPSGGINIAFVIIASVVIVLAVEFFLRRRDKHATAPLVSSSTDTIVDTETDTVVPVPEAVIQPAKGEAKKAPAPKKKPVKKSKSKRKKK